jgi:CRP-like cAMP-binding protein
LSATSNVLTRKLEIFGPLPEEDRAFLDKIVRHSREVDARTSIIREGEPPTDVHLVLRGIACRSKTLADGQRQIFAYMVPGDFCDLNVFILKRMDHDIETLSPCTMVEIPREVILEMSRRPMLVRALWWATLVDEATLREWIVNIGQRNAKHRIAHLICEIHLRMKSVGLTNDGRFELPITQSELGETMGLSAVHVNRTIQILRSRNLIVLKGSSLEILDVAELQRFADFNSNYLHLETGK